MSGTLIHVARCGCGRCCRPHPWHRIWHRWGTRHSSMALRYRDLRVTVRIRRHCRVPRHWNLLLHRMRLGCTLTLRRRTWSRLRPLCHLIAHESICRVQRHQRAVIVLVEARRVQRRLHIGWLRGVWLHSFTMSWGRRIHRRWLPTSYHYPTIANEKASTLTLND